MSLVLKGGRAAAAPTLKSFVSFFRPPVHAMLNNKGNKEVALWRRKRSIKEKRLFICSPVMVFFPFHWHFNTEEVTGCMAGTEQKSKWGSDGLISEFAVAMIAFCHSFLMETHHLPLKRLIANSQKAMLLLGLGVLSCVAANWVRILGSTCCTGSP